MKNLLAIFTLMLGAVCFGQEKEADMKDLENLSMDICSCVNENLKGMSGGILNIFQKYADDPVLMEEKVLEYTMDNPEAAMDDIEKMEVAGVKIEECSANLEAKYDGLYTDFSEDELMKKVTEILTTKEQCRLTLALIKIGESEEE